MTQKVDDTKALKRLEKELKKFKKQKLPNVECVQSKKNKLIWIATVTAPVKCFLKFIFKINQIFNKKINIYNIFK